MGEKLIKYKFRPFDYRPYGLNPKRACFENNKIYILSSPEELDEFATESLMDIDCNAAALFVYTINGDMIAYVKTLHRLCDEDIELDEEDLEEIEDLDVDDEDELLAIDIEKFICTEKDDIDFFAEIDDEFRLCCYSLMIQQIDGDWRMI